MLSSNHGSLCQGGVVVGAALMSKSGGSVGIEGRGLTQSGERLQDLLWDGLVGNNR